MPIGYHTMTYAIEIFSRNDRIYLACGSDYETVYFYQVIPEWTPIGFVELNEKEEEDGEMPHVSALRFIMDNGGKLVFAGGNSWGSMKLFSVNVDDVQIPSASPINFLSHPGPRETLV